MERLKSFAVGYLLASLVAMFIMLLQITPHWPKTLIGWGLLFVASLPLVLVFEGLGYALFHDRVSQKLNHHGKAKLFSLGRMAYALIVMVSLIAALFLLQHLLTPLYGTFFQEHFR